MPPEGTTAALPIVYVRGFAGGASGIDFAVDDPFYGFNLGSTHVRVGSDDQPHFYPFEGPLLRLMTDHGYEAHIDNGQLEELRQAAPNALSPASVWVYRFYDAAADTFGRAPVPYRIEDAAAQLCDFVQLVLGKTKADQLYLVAHSMGGLICRSLIQRYLDKPEDVIAKVFTYGTPHGGIDITLGGPVADWVMQTFGPDGSDIFRPERMHQYLTSDARPMPDNWDPRSLDDTAFPAERFFCLAGTDSSDYDTAAGWSARAVGAASDGLVQIRNACVDGAPHAYVHRSHSGRYGMVNSEEGYQNLRRFLFGNLRVTSSLHNVSPDGRDGRLWQADVNLTVRGIPVLLDDQTAAHHCPVNLLTDAAGNPRPTNAPIPLVTTYLLPTTHPAGYTRYALNLRITSLVETRGLFHFADHLEQIADWEDTLLVDLHYDEENRRLRDARYAWNSQLRGMIADQRVLPGTLRLTTRSAPVNGAPWAVEVPLPDTGRSVLGDTADLLLSISPWSATGCGVGQPATRQRQQGRWPSRMVRHLMGNQSAA